MSAEAWRRFHGVMALVWMALVAPTILVWHQSVLWVGLMSVYACVMAHVTSWQSARAEVQAKENS